MIMTRGEVILGTGNGTKQQQPTELTPIRKYSRPRYELVLGKIPSH